MRRWFSDASFEAVAGLCIDTGVIWRYELTEEQRARTVRGRRMEGCARLAINVVDFLGKVMNANVMTVIRGDEPEKEEESVIIKGVLDIAL